MAVENRVKEFIVCSVNVIFPGDSFNKSQRDALFLKFILVKNSTQAKMSQIARYRSNTSRTDQSRGWNIVLGDS